MIKLKRITEEFTYALELTASDEVDAEIIKAFKEVKPYAVSCKVINGRVCFIIPRKVLRAGAFEGKTKIEKII